MKIKYCLGSLAMVAMLAACQNDVLDAPVKASDVTVTASREGSGSSRTTLTGDYKINWHEDDQLSVFLGSAANAKFTIHDGAGEDYATFKGNGDIYITGGTESSAGAFANVAYYPYDADLSVTKGDDGSYTLTTSWPSAQNYRDGSFGQDAYPMVAVAESNRDYAFSFKNVGSMLMLYLKGDAKISKIKLQSLSNKLAGACTVKAAYGQDPVLTLNESSADSEIILNCPDGVQLNKESSTVFVIAVPPISGETGDLTFTIYDTENGYMEYGNAAAYSVARNQYYTFGKENAIEYDPEDYAEDYVQDATGNVAIYSESGLSQFVTAVNEGDDFEGKTITLASDLVLSTVTDWTPIANGERSGNAASGNVFKGTFDGQNHTISGLAITTGEGDDAVGLFGVVDGGTIKNLKLADVNINTPNSELTGTVAGFVTGGGVIENVTVSSGTVKGAKGVGGVVGRATVSAIISNCENAASVDATGYNAGGIVGAVYYTAADKEYTGANAALVIKNCKNTGSVTAPTGAGGIAGLSSGSVTNCENTGEVTGNGTSIGGIVGEQKEAGEVIGCTNSGAVKNDAAATNYGTGGIIGWVRYPASEAGSGRAYEKQNVITVKGNINTASVEGGNDAGGIVGTVFNYAVVSDNNNSAATLKAKTFAAGVVGNVQFNDANAMSGVDEYMVEITNNTSTTALADMTVEGICKAPYAYDNSQGAHTKISGNGGCPDATTKEEVADGVMKLDDTTYELSKASGWSYFAETPQKGITIHIVADLDFTDVSDVKAIPAGRDASLTIKGNGHTISNAKVISGDEDNTTGQASMFYCFPGSTLEVSDLTLANITVAADDNGSGYAAAVVGYCEGAATLDNVDVTNAAITGAKSSGMLVGHLAAGGSLTAGNCDVSGTVTLSDYESGGHYAGKYIGTVQGAATLTNCTADVQVTGNTKAENVGTLYGRIVSPGSLTVDGTSVVSTDAQLAACLTADEENISVVLANDIDLPISSLGTQTAGSGEYKLGGESTKTVTIDLNKKKLALTTSYMSAIGAKNADATITIKNGTMTSTGNNATTWNINDVTFANCDYVIEDVTFEKEVALTNTGKSVVMNSVTINGTGNYYALWISARGQNVEFYDLTINSSNGRGIKIDEQYVTNPAKVTLKVTGGTFTTGEKAAIMVKSEAGADITLENINIENVAADKVYAVWCDEDASSYNDLITVTGGQKKIEGQ